MRLVDNYARFRRLLKGNMFGWGCGAYSDSVLFLGAVHKYTYLLTFYKRIGALPKFSIIQDNRLSLFPVNEQVIFIGQLCCVTHFLLTLETI